MPENKDSLNKRHLEAPLFAAANSGRGFVSFYENIFNAPNIVRRYLIKGGPGTGKSSFMRRVAAFAEDNGYPVEYYRLFRRCIGLNPQIFLFPIHLRIFRKCLFRLRLCRIRPLQ